MQAQCLGIEYGIMQFILIDPNCLGHCDIPYRAGHRELLQNGIWLQNLLSITSISVAQSSWNFAQSTAVTN